MSIRKAIATLGFALAASTAWANVTYTFTADGVTDGKAQQGTAVFVFSDDGSQLSLTLTDNVDPTAFIVSELDGFTFSLSDAPTTQTLLSVSAQSVINCTGVSGSTCPAGSGSSPYGYGSLQNGDEIQLGAGFTGTDFSYHPYAIVNASYNAPGGQGGLSNNQHNPLLVGPVTFTFALTGLTSAPEVTDVSFLFGTNPDSQLGTCTTGTCTSPVCTNGDCPSPDIGVPEPQTVALLAVGLLGIGWSTRRQLRKA
jgi:hypothetical protein